MAQSKSRTRSAKKQRQPLKKGREREQQVYFVQSMRWATRDFEDDCTGVQDEELIAAARTGDTEAQYRLGKLYAEGRKVPRDDERALYWFQRAAQPPVPGHEPLYKISYPCTKKVLPSSEATYEVGRAIWHGRGTEMDFGDAYAWWKMADAQGNDHARMALSAYHIPDNPRPMDDATFTCIVQMADAGDMDAQHCLGNCFFLGLGVSKDPAKAMEWWKKAAAQGHEHATYYAGASILQNNFPGSCEEAISLMEQAAGLGLRKAKCLLGNCYLHGDYVQQDPEKAVAYLTQAVEGGSIDARISLGAALVLGMHGVPKNRELGMLYLEEAALDAGDPDARKVLDQITAMEKMAQKPNRKKAVRTTSGRKSTGSRRRK